MRRSTSLWVVMMFGTLGCPGGHPDETGWDAGAQGSDSGSAVADAGEDLVDAGAALTFTVTIEVSEGGSASPQGIVEVESGESVVITLTPDEGFALREVTGTCGGARADLVYTTAPVESDCSLEAFFEAEPTPEPAAYCSRIPAARRDLIVCDPEQNFDDWSQGRAYRTNGLRIPRGKVVALPFTANAQGARGIMEITNNMPGLHASGLMWHGWFSEIPGGDRVEDIPYCRRFSPNPNPMQMRWNQTEPGGNECHLGAAVRTLYFNMEVACFEEVSDRCTPGVRYDGDYYVGVSARIRD